MVLAERKKCLDALANAEAWHEAYKHAELMELHNFLACVEAGCTLEAIGGVYGISRQRVHQILKAWGVERKSWRARR